MKKLKQELKKLSIQIRTKKSQRKSSPDGHVDGLLHDQWMYRHMHIAYCVLRGRTLDQIERKNRSGNAPNMERVDQFMAKYVEVADEETRCAS